TSQTLYSNASEEKDKDVELIVVPVKNTEEKGESRKSSTNSKKKEILTEPQQEKKASSTDTSEDNPKILAYRRELEEIALKHLGTISENNSTSTPSVNTGNESVNTGRFDPDDSPMPELKIFHKSETDSEIEVSPTLGEEQVEDISPTTIKAAAILTKVKKIKSVNKGKRYKRRKSSKESAGTGLDFEEVKSAFEEVNTGGIKVSTGIEEINAGSLDVNTGSDLVTTDSIRVLVPSPDKEEAGLAEAIRLDALEKALEKEEVAKQVHLDSLLDQRMAEEQELTEEQKKRKAQVQFEAQSYTEEDWDTIRAKLEANAELKESVLGKDLSVEDYAKRMVELVNQRRKHFAEERARAKRNKPMTQTQLRNYMSNFLKNQGTWKLTQLKKLNFEEVKAEFEKLIKQLDTYVPMNLEATKESLKRLGEELQTKTAKKLKFDDESTQPTEEKVEEDKDDKLNKKIGKRRKHIVRKGLHIDLNKDDSEDSDEASEKDDSTSSTKIPINHVPVAIKSPNIANYKIFKQGRKGVYHIVRENRTDMVYISFGAMLTDISIDDLTKLYRIVMRKHGQQRLYGGGGIPFQLNSDSLPHDHAQTTKTYYKHQDSSIKKAQVLKTKTSANSDKQDLPLSYQVYYVGLLASFQNDAKYEHVGQDTRSQVYSLKRSREDNDKDEDPSPGSDRGLKKRKKSKDDEPTKGSKTKESKSGSSKGTKSQSKSSGKSIQVEEPEFENAGKTPQQGPTQSWLITLAASSDKPSKTFDDLMRTPIDFSAYIMNGLKITNLTQETLLGPVFKLLKGGISTMAYKTSLTKTKVAQYDLPGIEDMVPNIWSPVKVAYDKHTKWGISYWREQHKTFYGSDSRQGDFPRLRINDIEDMLLLSMVIQKRVEDLQLGVERYQKKINITIPETTRQGIRKKDPYTPYQDPQGFIYVDNQGRNKSMRLDELYKISEGTLTRLRSSLDDITKNF
ncbi:hypothetical protein Tco_0236215, partial [Tanacetum coccineum]